MTEVQPDEAALRAARRELVLAQMERAGVDILITGREANARYIAGVPRLWIAGSRPFGPGCVLIRATKAIHLVTTWDEGVPDDIPHENLHGITFNSANVLTWLRDIDEAGTVKTVATDGLMPSTVKVIAAAFPAAELVDGEQLMRRVRRIKLPAEIDAIGQSIRIAENALAAAESALAVGITERQLTARFMEAMAEAGVTTPTTQDVAWITSRDHVWARKDRDTAVAAGDLVAFDAGVIAGGYVGELGRTKAVAAGGVPDALNERWQQLWDGLLRACRPGLPASRLLDAYADAGLPPPPQPVAHGLGLGDDLPVVTHAMPRTAAEQPLEAGMVLTLCAYVWEPGVGAMYGLEPVLITDRGPELMATHPSCDPRSLVT